MKKNNKTEAVVFLPLSKVTNHPLNPRTGKNPKYDAIFESIKIRRQNDVPIRVYERPDKKGEYYTYAGGGTRLAVLSDLQIKNVRCIISDDVPDDATVLAHHITENMMRGDTTFPETAKAVNIIISGMPALSGKAKSPSLQKIKEFLAEKGLAVSSTSISLYLKADFLFHGWVFYPFLSKRIVENASVSWANMMKGIREYDSRTPTHVLRERIILPVIAERNKKSNKMLSMLTSQGMSYDNDDPSSRGNLSMEVRMLFSEFGKRAGKHYGQKEAEKNEDVDEESAVILARDVMRSSMSAPPASAEENTDTDDGEASEEPTTFRERAQKRQELNNTSAEQREKENQAAKEQNKQNNIRITISRTYRRLLKDLFDETEAGILKKKGDISIKIPRDLCAQIYLEIVAKPSLYMSGQEQGEFFKSGNGRLHAAIENKEIDLEELLATARSEAESGPDTETSEEEGDSTS